MRVKGSAKSQSARIHIDYREQKEKGAGVPAPNMLIL